MPSLSARATYASLWSGLDSAVRTLLTFGITIVLARLLTPAEFGILAMILVFSAIASVIADFGLGTALIQRRNATHLDESTAFFFNVGLSAVLAAGLIVAAPWVARYFAQPVLEPLAWVMAATLIVSALGSIHTTLLTKALTFRPLAFIGFWSSLLSGALAITLAVYGYGVWSLAWQVLAQASITTLLLWIWHPWRPSLSFSAPALKGLLAFGGPFLAARLIDTAYQRAYSVFIGKMFSAADLGFYSRAQSTQQMPASTLTRVLNRVAVPAFSEAAESPARLSAALAKSSRLLMFINLPAMLGLGLTAAPFVELVFGARWLPSAPLLMILCLGGTLWPLQVLNISALIAQGQSALILKLEVVKKSIGILILAITCRWGLEAIAWGQVFAAGIALFINTHYSGRLLQFGTWAQLKALWRVAVAALAMAVAVWGLGAVMVLPPLLRLVAMIAAGVAVYFGTAVLLGEFPLQTLRQVIGRARRGDST